jgi:hypothetical protein
MNESRIMNSKISKSPRSFELSRVESSRVTHGIVIFIATTLLFTYCNRRLSFDVVYCTVLYCNNNIIYIYMVSRGLSLNKLLTVNKVYIVTEDCFYVVCNNNISMLRVTWLSSNKLLTVQYIYCNRRLLLCRV